MTMTLPSAQKHYLTITLSYWAFTLTDGALRMLVLFFFHGLGYSPIELASLFILYEFFGILTNLYGGWLATRIGLNTSLHIGLALQILALGMLTVDPLMLSLVYVMIAQALSGIAKDLNKMSAKSSIKLLLTDNQKTTLYHWVALLTGSKNSLKGLGFFPWRVFNGDGWVCQQPLCPYVAISRYIDTQFDIFAGAENCL